MAIFGRKAKYDGDRIIYAPTGKIDVEAKRYRRDADERGLTELAASIARYGVIEPIIVYRTKSGYGLIAGERRLRAAMLAGLKKVPCIAVEADAKTASALSLCENLHRREFDYIDVSRGVFRYMQDYGEDAAQTCKALAISKKRMGETLKILRLTGNELAVAKQHGLTERHLLSILKLGDEEKRSRIIGQIITNHLTEKETDALIEGKLYEMRRNRNVSITIRDMRIFLNTVQHAADILTDSGMETTVARTETEDATVVTVTIAKRE